MRADKFLEQLRQVFDKDTYCTPNWILAPIYDFFGQIDLDPCSGTGSVVISVDKFTKVDDGLSKDWAKHPLTTVFCNPPYSRGSLGPWSAKCAAEGCAILLLVPNYSSASWFQENVFKTATSILFYKRRISFVRPDGGKSDSPTFHSVLVYWGRRPKEFREAFQHQGRVICLVE